MKWPELPAKLRCALKRYAMAQHAQLMNGSKMPEEWPAIAEELKKAKQYLVDTLQETAPQLSPEPKIESDFGGLDPTHC